MILEECDTRVVQEVQHTDTRERLHHDVREDRGPVPRVHRLQLRERIPQLGRRVDDDEDVRQLQLLAVPEEHPRADADIPQCVVRHEPDDLVELPLLLRVARVELPELVEPGELEELLGEEEGADEEGLRGPEGEVGVVDVLPGGRGSVLGLLQSERRCLHVRAAPEAILLEGKVVCEGSRGEVSRGTERDAHGCCDGKL